LIYDYDGDGSIDVFLAFDKKDEFTDETYPQNSGPVSAYGINFFKTPKKNPADPMSKDIGITSTLIVVAFWRELQCHCRFMCV